MAMNVRLIRSMVFTFMLTTQNPKKRTCELRFGIGRINEHGEWQNVAEFDDLSDVLDFRKIRKQIIMSTAKKKRFWTGNRVQLIEHRGKPHILWYENDRPLLRVAKGKSLAEQKAFAQSVDEDMTQRRLCS